MRPMPRANKLDTLEPPDSNKRKGMFLSLLISSTTSHKDSTTVLTSMLLTLATVVPTRNLASQLKNNNLNKMNLTGEKSKNRVQETTSTSTLEVASKNMSNLNLKTKQQILMIYLAPPTITQPSQELLTKGERML